MVLNFTVDKQIITRTDNEKVVRLSRNYLYAHFEFSDDWIGEKTAVFKHYNEAYNMLLDSDGTCLVPWEILKCEHFDVSVFCGDLITANAVKVFTIASGYALGDGGTPPTPSIYEQIIAKLNEIEAEVDPEAIERTVDAYLADKDFVTEDDVEQFVADYIEAHKSEWQGSEVEVTPILSSGTKIAEIEVDGEKKDIYAPSGGGANPYFGKNVVHMGDSWVHVYGIAEDAAQKVGYNVTVCGFQATAISDYNTVLSDALEFSLIRLAKAIESNDWSAQDAAIAGSDPRGYAQPLARLKAVDWANTEALILSYGVNDYGAQNPLGDAYARDEESVCGALIGAINILQSLNPNMEIIVTTPCFKYESSDGETQVNYIDALNILDKYRKAIALTAKTCAVKLVDMFAISGINEGNHSLTLLSDGLHPTALGVDKWGNAFANCIKNGYVGAIDTNNIFTFDVDNLCFDSEKLDVHEKWNGSYTSGGVKYLCTRRYQQYGNCILGMKHYDSLPVGTVIALNGYGKKIGDTNHRISFAIKNAALTSDLLEKFTAAINNTTDSAISYSFTTTEAYTDCWVVFYVKQMSKWVDGKALVRDMKCTVTLPS